MAQVTKRLTARFYREANGREPVRDWLRGLPPEERKLLGRDIMAVEIGWPVGLPLCRPLRGGIWEVRTDLPHGTTARVLFCFGDGVMVLLHGFKKTSRKTPPAEVDLAMKRMKGLG
jgi:phage-related protein